MKRRIKPGRKPYQTDRRPQLQPVDRRGWRLEYDLNNDRSSVEQQPSPRDASAQLAS